MENKNQDLDYHFESMHPDDIAELLTSTKKDFETMMKEKTSFINQCSSKLQMLGDINYPYTCYVVSGQENACKLTTPSDLPTDIRGIYLIDSGLSNIYATQSTLLTGIQACVYSHFGKSGTATISGMSAMRFNTTRQDNPTSQHNFGKAFDVKLQGKMKSNGSSYDQVACAELCFYCVNAGATRVFFSDQSVVDAVNKATGKSVCSNIAGHENHIHMDCR